MLSESDYNTIRERWDDLAAADLDRTDMKQRKLGRGGPMVSALGLGCMGMSDVYGGRDETESIATLERALDGGITFFDTADVYGPHTNEELLGRVLERETRAHCAGDKVRPYSRSGSAEV